MKTINKNIEQIWALVCGTSSIDQDTNSLSLFNTVEEITINKKKETTPEQKVGESFLVQIPLEIVLMLRKNRLDQTAAADMRIDLIDPEEKSLQNLKAKLEIKKEHKRLRFRIKMNGIKVTIPGDYLFRISTKEPNENTFSKIGEIPFEVKIK